jgi:hypothetical protein
MLLSIYLMKKFSLSLIILIFLNLTNALTCLELEFSTLNLYEKETNSLATNKTFEGLSSIKNYLLNTIEDTATPITNKNYYKRQAVYLPLTFINYSISYATSTVIHEVGHAEKAYHFGATTSLGIDWLGQNQKTGLNVYELFWQVLTTNQRAFASWEYTNLTIKEKTFITGSGPNTNTIYSSYLANKFNFQNNYNVFGNADYFINKIINPIYSGNNLDNKDPQGDYNVYVKNLNKQNISTSVRDIYNLEIISLLLSGGLYNTFLCNQQYTTRGIKDFQPISMLFQNLQIYIPEHSVYLNSDNVSYSIETNIRDNNNIFYTLGIENSVIGNSKPIELSFGCINSIKNWDFETEININSAFNYFIKSKISLKLTDSFSTFAMIYLGDQATLKQQREWLHSPSIIIMGINLNIF